MTSAAAFQNGGREKSGLSVIRPFFEGAVLGIVILFLTVTSCTSNNKTPSCGKEKRAVILDTDICDDIDDTWALAMLLSAGEGPEFDVKLIITESGNTTAKAKMVAKFLETVGRTDIPVGIGIQHHNGSHRYDVWAKDYDLSSYPGTIYQDGVQALIDTIMKSQKPITVIAIGPLPNIAEALRREPRIAEKAEFIGMHGSIRRGYGGGPQPDAEWNVKGFIKESQKVFTAPWNMTITPLDACGIVQLKGEKYQKVLKRNSHITWALMENYRIWTKGGIVEENKDLSEAEVNKRADENINFGSSTLYDTVAIYLAGSTRLVRMEKLGIKVTDDGFTRIDDKAKVINCATEWKDLSAFEDFIVDRLTKGEGFF